MSKALKFKDLGSSLKEKENLLLSKKLRPIKHLQ